MVNLDINCLDFKRSVTFIKELICPGFLGFIFLLSSSSPSLASDQNPEVSRAVSQCLLNQMTVEQCTSLTPANTLTNKEQNWSHTQAVVCLSNVQASKEKLERGDFAHKCNIQPLVNLSVPTNNLFQPTTLRAPARR